MATKTNFKGIFTKDIEERISLKDIIKQRKADEKRMREVMRKYQAKMKKKFK